MVYFTSQVISEYEKLHIFISKYSFMFRRGTFYNIPIHFGRNVKVLQYDSDSALKYNKQTY